MKLNKKIIWDKRSKQFYLINCDKDLNTNFYNNLKDNKSQLIPFKVLLGDRVGSIRYSPASVQEWRNSIYTYNHNYMKNLPALCLGKSQILWVKLSNFGNPLKLLVPSDGLNTVCGWIKYLCKVISQKIIEKEMGYRGSKSVIFSSITVKEQRVYGSYCMKEVQLRCTLLNFERNYQTRIPFKQIINKFRTYTFKTVNTSTSTEINPWFVTGFSDAESCFSISIIRNKKLKIGWGVRARFQINLSQKDKVLLEQIQNFLCVKGSIYTKNEWNLIELQVQSVKDLKKIIDHFDKYPLITQKFADYKLFKEAFNLILNKEHLTINGLRKIVSIKASMNLGLQNTNEIKVTFPDIIPVMRPKVEDILIRDPHWLVGFTEGEGCFNVTIQKSQTTKTGFSVSLRFQLTQHIRDIVLMQSLIKFWNCGEIFKRPDEEAVDFKVSKFSDLTDKVIPFFQRVPLHGLKSQNFTDFCKVADIMKEKGHLTEEGLDQIRLIKAGMNTGRVLD